MRILIDPTIWRLEISIGTFYNSKVEKAISFVPPPGTTHPNPPVDSALYFALFLN